MATPLSRFPEKVIEHEYDCISYFQVLSILDLAIA